MRLTLFLVLLNVFGVYARDSFSQNTRFNLDYKNTSIKQILEDVKNQGNLEFFFSNDDFDTNVKVDISVRNGTLKEVLDKIILSANLQYRLVDNMVIFSNAKSSQTVLQSQNWIKGIVTDPTGVPLPGVTIIIEGQMRGVITASDGSYSIEVSPGEKLVFSFLGMQTQTIEVGSLTTINVTLQEKTNELEDVTIVAFGKQKKESVISSIQTVDTKELRVPSSNLTTAFAGRIAGMISYQTSGEPGYDDATFFIRGVTSFGAGKVNPLILIDNVEVASSDLSKIHPDDIAGFSVLKDATATALYGARGANGVILITTKEGHEGQVKVSVRVENSFSSPTSTIKMADPITYMRLANEAVSTRNPQEGIPYSNSKIDNTMNPDRNPYVYPMVDWMDMLTKNVAVNQRANLNISGGGNVARYYIAGSFTQDNGILKVDKRNNFNSNVDYKKYLIHSNININLTKSTKAVVRMHGTFDDYNGPITGGSDMFKNILKVSPVRFPAYFETDKVYGKANHILFGNSGGATYLNPYAEMVKGYRQNSGSVMMAQFELEQDFSHWVKGLNARILGNTSRNSAFNVSRAYNPYYYEVVSYDRFTDEYTLLELNQGSEYIGYSPGDKTVSSSFYGEASVSYNRTFAKKHAVSGMLVSIIRNTLTANASTLAGSLPARNLGLSGRFTYGYSDRYFAEFNFGYNGSEKFDAAHRWGFFPSVGFGWVVSEEEFWLPLKDVVSKLKLRGTYGLVGNDEIGSERFFYLSEVLIGQGYSYRTGTNFDGINRSGISVKNYANPMITWETAYKSNLGVELGLFKGKVDIIADIFREHRTNILQPRADIPSEMGLWSQQYVNVGEANGKGVDVSVDYSHSINKDLWFVGRANFTFARSTYRYYEEPAYEDIGTPWRSRKGNPVSQVWGYVAERLFIDQNEIDHSPRQDFGEYLPGDIKYSDISGDGVINEMDLVPIGHPQTPEINYGFGLSAGYKNLDISVFFQGIARSSFWIDGSAMTPFVRGTSDGKVTENGLAGFIADDHWSELSQNPYANWPRLSNTAIANNNQPNTWFMRDRNFLRLKSAEVGYSLSKAWVSKLKLASCRFYLSGTNLLLFSKFKLWDVEMGGDGLGYPLQRVINMGINFTF